MRSVAFVIVSLLAACGASSEPPEPATAGLPEPSSSRPVDEFTADDYRRLSPDWDGDGLKGPDDNCVTVANIDQQDTDEDGVGDVCEVILLAREDLARRLNGNAAVLGIWESEVTPVTWPDRCLGSPSTVPCAPAETPGYRLIFTVSGRAGRSFLYHTDLEKDFRFIGEVESSR